MCQKNGRKLVNYMEKLRQLQLCELHILKDVVAFCNKRNIKYYLIGGTLLGAVRHEGFIPWDDDIDIGMMRSDYETFLNEFGNAFPNKYFVQNKDTDKKVMPSFTKIRWHGTRFIEKSTEHMDIHKGIFIDIFPLDNIPERDSFILEIRYRIFKFYQILSLFKSGYRPKEKNMKNVLYSIILKLLSIISYNSINNYSLRFMKRYINCDTNYVSSFASGYNYKKQRMSKDIYGQGVELLFEGDLFRCPSKYSEYLEKLFGDYMKLPDIDKRRSHTDMSKVELCQEVIDK